jgi:type I restriction enzyme S subunit
VTAPEPIYPRFRLADIATVKGGKRLPPNSELLRVITPHPYIRGQDIRDGKISFDDPTFIDAETHQRIQRYTVSAGDVCITIVGNIGDVGIVPQSLHGANLTENAVKLIDLRADCDPRFLAYALLSHDAQSQMKLSAAGAAQPKLGIYKVNEIRLVYPPIQVQRRIAAILSAYDDLIENNLRRIKILEEMARALYREWFVEFRFPGHAKVPRVASAMGPIPKGWEVASLSSLVDFAKGRKPKETRKTSLLGDVKLLLIAALEGGANEFTSPEKLVIAGTHDTIMVMDGASSCDVAIGFSGAVGSTLGRFRVKETDSFSPHALYHFLASNAEGFKQKNIGAAIPHANKDYILSQLIAIPPRPIMSQFDTQVTPIHSLIEINKARVQNLRRTRDLLLPRLLNGVC